MTSTAVCKHMKTPVMRLLQPVHWCCSDVHVHDCTILHTYTSYRGFLTTTRRLSLLTFSVSLIENAPSDDLTSSVVDVKAVVLQIRLRRHERQLMRHVTDDVLRFYRVAESVERQFGLLLCAHLRDVIV